MSLVTGCKLERQQWNVIPMPSHVIQVVESMAEREEQPLLQNGEMIFEWGPNRPIIEEHEQNVEYTDTDEVEQEIEVEEELIIQPDDDEYSNVEEVGEIMQQDLDLVEVLQEPEAPDEQIIVEDIHQQVIKNAMHDVNEGDNDVQRDVIDNPDVQTESEYTGRGYNLRSRNTRDYNHRLDHVMDNPGSSQSYDVQLFQHDVLNLNCEAEA